MCLTYIVYMCNRFFMKNSKKHVSEAESKVLEVLWRSHPLTADQIIEGVAKVQGWSPATVKTLLNRMLAKGAISAERDGRRYLYSPILTRDDYMATESQGLLDRLFEGRVSSMFAHFSKHQKLSKEDVAELKKLIGEMENES